MRYLVLYLVLFSWLAGTRAWATCDPITCNDYAPGNPLVSWLDLDWRSTFYYGGTTGEVPAVKGTVIWMAANTHLDSSDATDPRDIRRIQSLPMPNLARHITIAGDFAYTTGQYGLVITDISDPVRPVIMSSGLHNDLDAAEYKDGYLYAISYERVVVINVRMPRTPTVVASYLHGRPLLDIGLYGNLILAQDNEGRTLCLAQPSTSSLQRRWLVDTEGIRLAIHGDYFHVTNNFALAAYRLQATGQPNLVGSIPLAYGGRVTTIGDILYVCDLAGFRLFDATSAPALVELNHLRGPWAWARPVALVTTLSPRPNRTSSWSSIPG
ncbi:MAG: hypothetical protein IPI48_11025 [bacterium]|nr:hypothetical protein [bacterium]